MLARTGNIKNSLTLLMGIHDGMATWKTVWWFLTKLSILIPCNVAIVFLGVYPKELKPEVSPNPEHVYNSFIHNHPNLEATKVSFSR